EDKDGKPTAQTLGAPIFNGQASVEDLRADGQAVTFTLKAGANVLKVTLAVPQGKEKPDRLKGVIEFNGRKILAEMEKTEEQEISRADAVKTGPAGTALNQARGIRDGKEQLAALKGILEKYPDSSAAYVAAQMALEQRTKEGATDDELRAAVQECL